MVEPRDYDQFLKAKPDGPLGTSFGLLPQPPPAATLWTEAIALVTSALLPLGLWVGGWLDPLDVILLYLAAGTSYSLAIAARRRMSPLCA